MAKPPSDQAEKIVVRLPDGMRERLAEAARANNRSVNAEVVVRLGQSFDPQMAVTRKELQAMDDRVRQIEDAFARLKSGVDYIVENDEPYPNQ